MQHWNDCVCSSGTVGSRRGEVGRGDVVAGAQAGQCAGEGGIGIAIHPIRIVRRHGEHRSRHDLEAASHA